MAKMSKREEVQSTLAQAAKTGADNLRTVAGEALGAAVAAATGVLMDRVVQALAAGEKNVADATPGTQGVMQGVIVDAVGPKGKKRAAAKRKVAPRKRPALKKIVVNNVTLKKKAAKKKPTLKSGRR